jgi:hypothetical protein
MAAEMQVSVGDETSDLNFYAPHGLRGRFWQSPDHGAEATRHLFKVMLSTLMTFTDQNPPPPTEKAAPIPPEDVLVSLESLSPNLAAGA